MTIDYYSELYWKKLFTALKLKSSWVLCEDWCTAALEQDGVSEKFTKVEANFGTLLVKDGWPVNAVHYWLESEVKGRIFIADGTAGQYEAKYPSGFYGFLDEAPTKLKEIYSYKIE